MAKSKFLKFLLPIVVADRHNREEDARIMKCPQKVLIQLFGGTYAERRLFLQYRSHKFSNSIIKKRP